MIKDDIIYFLTRHQRCFTASQIADAVESSSGRINTLLHELRNEGIVEYYEMTKQGHYTKNREYTYYVWCLRSVGV